MDVIADLWVIVLPILTAFCGWIANWFINRKKVANAKMEAEVGMISLNAELAAETAKLLHEQWKYENIISFFTPSALYEHTDPEIVKLLPDECKICANVTITWINKLLGVSVDEKLQEMYNSDTFTFALVSSDMGVLVDCGGIILASNRDTVAEYAKQINTIVVEVY